MSELTEQKLKGLKIIATITIGYDDMPIEFFENEKFTISIISPFTTRFGADKYGEYKEIIKQISRDFDKAKNQILADSEILKEYCFRNENKNIKEKENGGYDMEKRKQEMPELKDTVELMTSADYKDRFKAEYYQLKIRYTKLKNMYYNWDHLTFTPSCSKEIYSKQLAAMSSYLSILEARAKIENIILD